MSLQEWLEHVGMANAAHQLAVPYRTVVGWKYRGSIPKAKTLRKIVKVSKGLCTYESILNGK